MAGETTLTFIGNLTSDPELRFTRGDQPVSVASLTVAANETRRNAAGEWEEFGEPMFLRCSVWRDPFATNVAETLAKGMRVVVTGRLRARSWEDKHQQKRTDLELDVTAIGPDLRTQRAVVQRPARDGATDPTRGAVSDTRRPSPVGA